MFFIPQGSVFCLALNDSLLVSGSFDGSFAVWCRREAFNLVARVKERHTDMIYGLAVNGKDLIARYGISDSISCR